uniref:Protein-glutamine gamma-glutamyltransferase 4 n=2 Tax=Anthurium amnicola TaxID=1678845 RepID=A0A1D1XJS4_9ARAE
MDDSRLPYDFSINPNLQCIQPLQLSPSILSERQALERNQHHVSSERQHVKPQPDKIKNLALQSKVIEVGYSNSFSLEQDDFPPLGDSSTTNKNKTKRSTT